MIKHFIKRIRATERPYEYCRWGMFIQSVSDGKAYLIGVAGTYTFLRKSWEDLKLSDPDVDWAVGTGHFWKRYGFEIIK